MFQLLRSEKHNFNPKTAVNYYIACVALKDHRYFMREELTGVNPNKVVIDAQEDKIWVQTLLPQTAMDFKAKPMGNNVYL